MLGKTLGVPLFQEQAMKVVMVAAGFTRRRGRPAAPRDGGVAEERGDRTVPPQVHQRHARATATPASSPSSCFNQIRGFGEYGFPESHAASFALLVYASAGSSATTRPRSRARCSTASRWAFTPPAQLVRDAREHGVEVRAGGCECTAIGTARWKDPLAGGRE